MNEVIQRRKIQVDNHREMQIYQTEDELMNIDGNMQDENGVAYARGSGRTVSKSKAYYKH